MSARLQLSWFQSLGIESSLNTPEIWNMHASVVFDTLHLGAVHRHMFALKYEALQNGMPLPAIYQDKAYQVCIFLCLCMCVCVCVCVCMD